MSFINWPGGREWPEIIDRAAAQGVYLAWRDNLPDFDVAAFQAVADAYSLADAKAWMKAQSVAIAKSLRDRVIAQFSPGELAAWSIKRDEAMAFAQSGNPADAPLLSAEATSRGITLAALVGKVAGNSATFGALEAAIGGADGKHRDTIDAAADFAALAAHDVTAGWPAV